MKHICFIFVLFSVACGGNKELTHSPPTVTTTSTTTITETITNHPKNIIFMVGDGMGLSQITAAMYMNDNKIAFERCKHVGLHKSHARGNLVTDSAAGATAFSCGEKTYNGAIGVNMEKQPMKTILESAEDAGLETGMVATCGITHATPGSFVAHQEQRKMYEEIAADIANAEVEVLIGGGRDHFTKRVDEQDLLQKMKDKGYEVTNELQQVTANNDKIAVILADEHPPKKSEGRDYLKDASNLAIARLSKSEKGFFLLVEGSQIDWGGHANEHDYIISELLDFNETVHAVLDFAETNQETLVVITADHETGGFAINPGSKMNKKIVPGFTTGQHTASMIPVFAFGPGAEAFMGIYENTAIYHKMMAALQLEK